MGRKISTSRCLGEKVAPQHEKTQARGQKSPRRALRNNQYSLSGTQTAYVRVCVCACVSVCVCRSGWWELLWKDSLGESTRAWGILKALFKTLAYAAVVGRNGEGSVLVCSYSGNLTCMGLCLPASCFLSSSPIKASLVPGRRLGELPSLMAPYTPYGEICGGYGQQGASNLHMRWAQ